MSGFKEAMDYVARNDGVARKMEQGIYKPVNSMGVARNENVKSKLAKMKAKKKRGM